MTTEQTGDQTFVGDPNHYLFGVFETHEALQAAEQELIGGSFSADQVKHYEGRSGAHEIDSSGQDHGTGSKLLRAVQHLFTNLDHLSEYEEATRQGKAVLAVHIEDGTPRDEALEVFRRNGAHFVNYYGNALTETLIP